MERTSPFFTHEQAPDGQCPTHGKALLDIGHSQGKLYCPEQSHDGRREHKPISAPEGTVIADFKTKEDPEWLA